MQEINQTILRRAGQRAAQSPAFLGWYLQLYLQFEQWSEVALVQWLGIDADQLQWLTLCRRPRPEHFAADVEAIAGRVGAPSSRLGNLVRQVEVLDALRAAEAQPIGILAAARDREDEVGASDGGSTGQQDRSES